MRHVVFALVTALSLGTSTAHAKWGDGKKGHDDGGGNKKGKKGKGKKGGGGPKPPQEPKKAALEISGAGQRLSFSFGGKLFYSKKFDKMFGKFSIVAHPSAPSGTTLNVVCRYNWFSNPEITGNTLEVDAHGHCRILSIEGDLETVETTGHLAITDNAGGTDTISVTTDGPGLAIPGGELSFGDLRFATTTPPAT